jgi:hypothetical protein
VPFDISAAEIDKGNTHFEQAYGKASNALHVARAVFNRIQTATAAIRDQNEERDLDTVVLQQEQAYERQLLDIYGFPYQEDIGPGKLYPDGYIGPDLNNYSLISRYDFFGRIPLDTSEIRREIVRPTIIGDGTRFYDPGELVPPLPSSDPSLAIEDILQFVKPEWAAKYSEIKGKYTSIKGKITKAEVDALGIPELTAFYHDVIDSYDSVEGAVFGAVESAVQWFDGVISAPVDMIDEFISNWVGPTEQLTELKLKGPNITFTTNQLRFRVGIDGLPTKPDNYTSVRRAEGEIQVALSQFVLSLREATAAIAAAEDHYKKMVTADSAFRNKIGADITAYYQAVDAIDQRNSLQQIMSIVNKTVALVEKVYADGMELYNAVEAAIPDIAGFSFDIGAAAKGPLRAVAAAVNIANTVQKLANQEQIIATEEDVEMGKRILEVNAQAKTIFKDSTDMALKVVDAGPRLPQCPR